MSLAFWKSLCGHLHEEDWHSTDGGLVAVFCALGVLPRLLSLWMVHGVDRTVSCHQGGLPGRGHHPGEQPK